MPNKLIGTRPNQVPSNADLGTAAYIDAKDVLLSRGGSIAGVDTEINISANDVFVYDTTLDSDAGMWRKKTQNTSWYNEKLNDTNRGAKREFPAVAIIVVDSQNVTIYDGDDPDCPMWMRFNSDTASYGVLRYFNVRYQSNVPYRAFAMNGKLAIAITGALGGLLIIDFVKDSISLLYEDSLDERRFDSGISKRNVIYDVQVSAEPSDRHLVSRDTNDVAMYVYPNAPVDYTTGLPEPTIAVATEGGVTVLRDNGSYNHIVVTNGSYTYSKKVTFFPNGALGLSLEAGSAAAEDSFYVFNELPDDVGYTNITVDTKATGERDPNAFYSSQYANQSNVDLHIYGKDTNRLIRDTDGPNFATPFGLTRIYENYLASNQGIQAYIGADFNTGWLPGKIKHAVLNSTVANDIHTNELAPQNAATSDMVSGEVNATTGWTAHNSATISSVNTYNNGAGSSYSLYCNLTGGSSGCYFSAAVEAGKTYTICADLYMTSASGGNTTQLEIGRTVDATQFGDIVFDAVNNQWQTVSHSFTATADETLYFLFREAGSTNPSFWLDNVSLRESDIDRTANFQPLANPGQAQIVGRIQKTAVASGADLVAYSGFSSTNFIRIPFSSNISGREEHGGSNQAHSCFFWFKDDASSTPATWQAMVIRGNYNGSSWDFYEEFGTNGNVAAYAYNDGNGNTGSISASQSTADNKWHMYAFTFDGDMARLYVDGRLEATYGNDDQYYTDKAGSIMIGANHNNGNESSPAAMLTLVRYSHTHVSDEVIKKMYNDEKKLFQENAKATLYGTDSSVLAVSLDRSTDLLHVGTPDGRSVFNDLQRIDHTNEAVGSRISAVNNFVVEE